MEKDHAVDNKNEPMEENEQEVETPEQSIIEELTKERDDFQDKFLRSQAELQNFRRRTEKEKADIYRFGNEKFLIELLKVVDNVERALESVGEEVKEAKIAEGIKLIEKSLRDLLEKEGVKPIEAIDQDFDPNLHHAVLTEEVEGVEEGKVIQELQKGYLIHDKTLRPSMVKVSQ